MKGKQGGEGAGPQLAGVDDPSTAARPAKVANPEFPDKVRSPCCQSFPAKVTPLTRVELMGPWAA